jgi:hypothetical protein
VKYHYTLVEDDINVRIENPQNIGRTFQKFVPNDALYLTVEEGTNDGIFHFDSHSDAQIISFCQLFQFFKFFRVFRFCDFAIGVALPPSGEIHNFVLRFEANVLLPFIYDEIISFFFVI